MHSDPVTHSPDGNYLSQLEAHELWAKPGTAQARVAPTRAPGAKLHDSGQPPATRPGHRFSDYVQVCNGLNVEMVQEKDVVRVL